MTKHNEITTPLTASPAAMGLAVGVGLVLAGIVAIAAYAGEAILAAFAVICVDGGVAALWILSAAGVGAWGLKLVRIPIHPALRFASSAALGVGLYSLAILLLGLMGGFGRVVAWSLFFVGLALGAWAVRSLLTARADSQPARPLNASIWIWVIAGLSWGTMLVASALPPGMLWQPEDPHAYDVLSYHLQVPREWYELGRMAPLMHNVFSFFPMGIEVHFWAGMELMGGAWRGMYFAQFFTGALAMVTAVGGYGVCRTLRPDSILLPTAAGVMAASTPWLIMLGSVAYTEAGLILYATLAVGWLLVGISGSGRMMAFAIGGAMAGFACGTKYTAVPMVLLAGPVATVIAILLARLRHRDVRVAGVITGSVLFVLVGGVLFSPWMIRNVAWAGNPVFPLLMPELGQGHFTDQQVERWEVAHAPAEADAPMDARFRLLGERILWHWQYGYVLPLVGILLGLAAWRDARAVTLLVMVLLILGIWFGFTHLQARFAVAIIPVLCMLVGLAQPVVWSRVVGVGAMAAVALVGWIQISTPLERIASQMRLGYFGMADLSPFMPAELQQEKSSHRSVSLVGGIHPFVYTIPMDRLTYRTVFDVHPSDDWQAAWLPDGLADLIVISPEEWHRLASHYRHVPPVPPEFRQQGTILLENPHR